MESDEALKYYLDEVKDTSHIQIEEEYPVQNEAEQATDFLQTVGLSNLSKVYQQGKEITENLVIDSVRQKNLTEKQAQTIRSRVRTLNKTLKSRQPRVKQRRDIRDISWNVETSSTGTRSRSATPDSLDSAEALNEQLSSDDDQQLSSLPPFTLNHSNGNSKTKIKWTTSEPLQNKKFNRSDRGDVAHLGSDNVVLKGYHPLNEYGTLPRPQRERSGSDPTTDLTSLQPKIPPAIIRHQSTNLHNQLSRSHNSITTLNNCSKVYLNSSDSNEDEAVSFEGLIKQNEINDQSHFRLEDGVSIDDLSDSEYQYLKPLLFVELVAIFDLYKINFHKRKVTIKLKGKNVFGIKLSTLVMRDMPKPTDNSMVPEIIQSIVGQLNRRCLPEEGILRIAGHNQKIDTLCNEVEAKFFSNRRDVEILLSRATVHDLTGLLKKLLRELPDPVLTLELLDMFYKTSAIPKIDDKIRALNLLVLMLPIEHRNTFRLLLEFFLNVIKHEKRNRMNLHNVAMITAPSFFPPKFLLPKDNKALNKEELLQQINEVAICCGIMETFLKVGTTLWTVPNHLACQAREAQKRAQDRKDMSKDKDRKIRSGKIKLGRSNTQYEPGVMNVPRIKRDFLI